MAARSHDLDQPKHIKKLFNVEGHILAKIHDSGSNGLSAIRNLKFRNNNNNKRNRYNRASARSPKNNNNCLTLHISLISKAAFLITFPLMLMGTWIISIAKEEG